MFISFIMLSFTVTLFSQYFNAFGSDTDSLHKRIILSFAMVLVFQILNLVYLYEPCFLFLSSFIIMTLTTVIFPEKYLLTVKMNP